MAAITPAAEDEEPFDDLFEIGDTLGAGSFSTVRACSLRCAEGRENPLALICGTATLAVKVYDRLGGSDALVHSLISEYRTLRSLHHRYIVRLLHTAIERDEFTGRAERAFVVLERACGARFSEADFDGPLFAGMSPDARRRCGAPVELFRFSISRYDPTRGAPMPEIVLQYIMLQLLSAVHFLHTREPPVIHRDLKPENVLVFGEVALPCGARAPLLKLGDFGAARAIAGDIMMTKDTGTGQHQAPELLVERGEYAGERTAYGPTVDVYSIGVSAFRLITGGSYPFTADDENCRKEAFKQRAKEGRVQWRLLDGLLSPEGIALLRGMLTPDPARRYSAVQCLSHPWFDPIRAEAARPDVLGDDTLLAEELREPPPPVVWAEPAEGSPRAGGASGLAAGGSLVVPAAVLAAEHAAGGTPGVAPAAGGGSTGAGEAVASAALLFALPPEAAPEAGVPAAGEPAGGWGGAAAPAAAAPVTLAAMEGDAVRGLSMPGLSLGLGLW